MQHSNRINGYAAIALTKLDILDTLDEVKIGVAYTLDGQTLKGNKKTKDKEQVIIEKILENLSTVI